MALLYTLSPVDVVPDIPVIGWVDDAVAVFATGLHLLEKNGGIQNQAFLSVLKLLKWSVILLGLIATALVAIAGVAIYKLVSG